MKLREFAASLGLSPTTVSRALNGYPEVAGATRDRVRRAAEAAGYRPSVAARALATGLAAPAGEGAIAILADAHALSRPGTGAILAGAAARAAEAGLVLRIGGDADKGMDGAAGVLRLSPGPLPPGPACVTVGEAGDGDAVWADVEAMAAKAAEHLVRLGHRRIAVLAGAADDGAGACRAGLARVIGADYDPDLAVEGAAADPRGVLDRAPPPTALIAADVALAHAARLAGAGRGLSVVALDRGPPDPRAAGLTAVRVPPEELGRRAVDLLLARRADPAGPPMRLRLAGDFVLGGSTGPASAG